MTSSRSIHVEQLKVVPITGYEVEIVERKGKGHPDSLIDGAAEAVSRGLCEYYQKQFGTILHHNVDKGLLVGGRSNPRFSGGEVVEPIYIVVAGRASSFVIRDGTMESVPVGGIALSSIKDFLKSRMRFLDTERHVIVDYKIKQGSVDLMSIYDRENRIPLSNDTSIGVGYAPLSPTESLTMESERILNSDAMKKILPEIGEDIKVMAFREGRKVKLTIAVATISKLIPDKSHYISVMEQATNKIKDIASQFSGLDVDVKVNSGDDYVKGQFYLTVTGTSAESGDDGNTGRGNRGNGLITPMRQYSMEATAGKNPVSHTGKLFNVLAQRAAERIQKEVKGIKENYVRILSKIGSPIDMPQIASGAVILEDGVSFPTVKQEVNSIINDELSKITSITPLILKEQVIMF